MARIFLSNPLYTEGIVYASHAMSRARAQNTGKARFITPERAVITATPDQATVLVPPSWRVDSIASTIQQLWGGPLTGGTTPTTHIKLPEVHTPDPPVYSSYQFGYSYGTGDRGGVSCNGTPADWDWTVSDAFVSYTIIRGDVATSGMIDASKNVRLHLCDGGSSFSSVTFSNYPVTGNNGMRDYIIGVANGTSRSVPNADLSGYWQSESEAIFTPIESLFAGVISGVERANAAASAAYTAALAETAAENVVRKKAAADARMADRAARHAAHNAAWSNGLLNSYVAEHISLLIEYEIRGKFSHAAQFEVKTTGSLSRVVEITDNTDPEKPIVSVFQGSFAVTNEEVKSASGCPYPVIRHTYTNYPVVEPEKLALGASGALPLQGPNGYGYGGILSGYVDHYNTGWNDRSKLMASVPKLIADVASSRRFSGGAKQVDRRNLPLAKTEVTLVVLHFELFDSEMGEWVWATATMDTALAKSTDCETLPEREKEAGEPVHGTVRAIKVASAASYEKTTDGWKATTSKIPLVTGKTFTVSPKAVLPPQCFVYHPYQPLKYAPSGGLHTKKPMATPSYTSVSSYEKVEEWLLYMFDLHEETQ